MKSKRTYIILGLAVLLAAASTTALAGTITGTAVSPTAITIAQGGDGAFDASITGVSGNVSSHPPNSPTVSYCDSWAIHYIGGSIVISCATSDMFTLNTGNYSQSPPPALPAAGNVSVHVDENVPCTAPDNVYTISEVFTAATGAGIDFGSGVTTQTKTVAVTVTCATPEAPTSCSHGYWKTHQTGYWPSPYTTSTKLGDVFDLTDSDYSSIQNDTFIEALAYSGGPALLDKAKLLMVQAVAAVLNASDGSLNYPLTSSEVVDDVNGALATKDKTTINALQQTLDDDNNLGGCPGDPTD